RMPAPLPRQEVRGAPSTAWHEAARTGRLPELERLLQQGADLNAPDDAGRTALVLAVIHGHSAMVQRLLALGANPALVDREGLNALQHARRLGREEIVRMLEAAS
ncbi:MAG: ankyrin repeat domain-containing protein, partial [Comamonadaceae bacterium]